MATQDTMSAWFWMMNSWLSTGGLLLLFFRTPMLPITRWVLRLASAWLLMLILLLLCASCGDQPATSSRRPASANYQANDRRRG